MSYATMGFGANIDFSVAYNHALPTMNGCASFQAGYPRWRAARKAPPTVQARASARASADCTVLYQSLTRPNIWTSCVRRRPERGEAPERYASASGSVRYVWNGADSVGVHDLRVYGAGIRRAKSRKTRTREVGRSVAHAPLTQGSEKSSVEEADGQKPWPLAMVCYGGPS
jgi:hypothetical protein